MALIKENGKVSALKSSSITGTVHGLLPLYTVNGKNVMSSTLYMQSGIEFYDDFSSIQNKWEIQNKWAVQNTLTTKSISSDLKNWDTAPGQLINYSVTNYFKLKKELIKSKSLAMRFYYVLHNESIVRWSINKFNHLVLRRSGNDTTAGILFPGTNHGRRFISPIFTSGEITYVQEPFM